MSGNQSSAAQPGWAESPLVNWVSQLQAGKSEALEPLIEHTQSRAWQVAYSILQNRQEVEDALQDAYLLVYQNIHQLKEPKAFWGWFKRMTVYGSIRTSSWALTV